MMHAARKNYGPAFLPELLGILCDSRGLRVEDLREVAQLLMVLVQGCGDNQKALESHVKGAKASRSRVRTP